MAVAQTIETSTHGRYLLRVPAGPSPWPCLVGFHGYAEDAETHLDALLKIPGIDRWLVVSVQALHPFYTREERVVANWMTRQDRDLAIADNVAYVGRVLNAVHTGHGAPASLAFAGFSQGGAMAYRSAAHYRSDALLILAADVPPDVAAHQSTPLPRVLIGRGERDKWYTPAKQADDVETLRRIGVPVECCVFDGAHEWTDTFYAAAGDFLRRAAGDAHGD